MNEMSAIILSKSHSKNDVAKIRTMQSPDDAFKLIKSRLLFVISLINQGSQLQYAKSVAMRDAQYLSEQISLLFLDMFDVMRKSKYPEDTRAFILWLTGTDVQEGYAQIILTELKDSFTQECLNHIHENIEQEKERLRQVDKQERENRLKLSGYQQKLLSGIMMNAKWAAWDGDGENTRLYLVKARKLTKLFIERKTLREKTNFI